MQKSVNMLISEFQVLPICEVLVYFVSDWHLLNCCNMLQITVFWSKIVDILNILIQDFSDLVNCELPKCNSCMFVRYIFLLFCFCPGPI